MRAVLLGLLLSLALPALAGAHCSPQVATRYLQLDGLRLAYQSIGREQDPALLLVMGLGGQLIHWPDEVVQSLCAQGLRVIRFDNRDVGLSTLQPIPATPT